MKPRGTGECSRCHDEPRLPGQRYGRKCKNEAERLRQQRIRNADRLCRKMKLAVPIGTMDEAEADRAGNASVSVK